MRTLKEEDILDTLSYLEAFMKELMLLLAKITISTENEFYRDAHEDINNSFLEVRFYIANDGKKNSGVKGYVDYIKADIEKRRVIYGAYESNFSRRKLG